MSRRSDFRGIILFDQTLHVDKPARHQRAFAGFDLDFIGRHFNNLAVNGNAVAKGDAFNVFRLSKSKPGT